MESWGSDNANFPNSGNPWLFRGGNVNNGSNAGLFATSNSDGGGNGNWAFRTALLVPPA